LVVTFYPRVNVDVDTGQCSHNVNIFVTLRYICYVNYSRCDQNIRFVDNC